MVSQSQNTKKSRTENSQFSQSQSQGGSQRALTEEQLEAAVENVTAYLLCESRNKRKILKTDVVANALNKSARQYAEVMKRAQARLDNIFGLQLARDPQNTDQFIIVNKHQKRFVELSLDLATDANVRDDVILSVVLASIFMKRGQMFESHVMTILEHVGFLSDKFYGADSDYNMKDYVTNLVKKTFVKQMYLDSEVVPRPPQAQNPPLPDGEQKVTVFKWGFRALMEVPADKIVEYLTKMHDGRLPAAFPRGYLKELKAYQEQMRKISF